MSVSQAAQPNQATPYTEPRKSDDQTNEMNNPSSTGHRDARRSIEGNQQPLMLPPSSPPSRGARRSFGGPADYHRRQYQNTDNPDISPSPSNIHTNNHSRTSANDAFGSSLINLELHQNPSTEPHFQNQSRNLRDRNYFDPRLRLDGEEDSTSRRSGFLIHQNRAYGMGSHVASRGEYAEVSNLPADKLSTPRVPYRPNPFDALSSSPTVSSRTQFVPGSPATPHLPREDIRHSFTPSNKYTTVPRPSSDLNKRNQTQTGPPRRQSLRQIDPPMSNAQIINQKFRRDKAAYEEKSKQFRRGTIDFPIRRQPSPNTDYPWKNIDVEYLARRFENYERTAFEDSRLKSKEQANDSVTSFPFMKLPLEIRERIIGLVLVEANQETNVNISTFRSWNRHHFLCSNWNGLAHKSIQQRNDMTEESKVECYREICPRIRSPSLSLSCRSREFSSLEGNLAIFRFPVRLDHPLFQVSRNLRNNGAFSYLQFEVTEKEAGIGSVWADLRWFLYNVCLNGQVGQNIRRMRIKWSARTGERPFFEDNCATAMHTLGLLANINSLRELSVDLSGYSLVFDWYRLNRFRSCKGVAVRIENPPSKVGNPPQNITLNLSSNLSATGEAGFKELDVDAQHLSLLNPSRKRSGQEAEGHHPVGISKRRVIDIDGIPSTQKQDSPSNEPMEVVGDISLENMIVTESPPTKLRLATDLRTQYSSPMLISSSPLRTPPPANFSVVGTPPSISHMISPITPVFSSRDPTPKEREGSSLNTYSPRTYEWTKYSDLCNYMHPSIPDSVCCWSGPSILLGTYRGTLRTTPYQLMKRCVIALYPLSLPTAQELPIMLALSKLRGLKDVTVGVAEGEEGSVTTEVAEWLLSEWVKPREDEISEKEIRFQEAKALVLNARRREASN